MNDDFYIGYLPRTSPGLARFVRRRVLLLLCLGALVPLLLVSTMSGFSRASFEFGVEREFEGTLRGGAVPLLLVDRPGGGGTSSYLLSAFGKFERSSAKSGEAYASLRCSTFGQ